jgi:glycogen synthase
MFAGRVERDKGVFDLIEIASLLNSERPGEYHFEVCGDGSAFEELQQVIMERNLNPIVKLLGRLNREQMIAAYGRSHAVIVPTTSRFSEGLCQVAAESILAGRPLISSRLCHALDYLGGATAEVLPDDVAGYARAISRLATDTEYYEERRAECPRLSEPFFDYRRSWSWAMKEVLNRAGEEGKGA